jgi:mannosylglycerate hydrolase
MTKHSILLHTHWDREWYASRETCLVRLVDVLTDLATSLETHGLTSFTLDGQTSLIHDALTLAPELATRLEPLLAEGRLHVGPWFTMPDTVLIGGEALLRNLVRGIKQARLLGCTEFCGYLPDSFGHSGALPTLFGHVGLTTAMMWRGRRLVPGQSSWFHWQGPDGNQVLTYQLPLGYFHTPLHPQEDEPETTAIPQQWQALTTQLAEFPALALGPTQPMLSHLAPLGGDHLAAPTPRAWQQLTGLLEQSWEVVHPHQYLAQGQALLQQQLSGAAAAAQSPLPIILGELRESGQGAPFLLSGTLSARLYLKQANARLERRLAWQTEPLLALANRHGLAVHPTSGAILDQAWQLMCYNQAHDSICGCSTDAVHRENETRYQQVDDWCDALEHRVLAQLSSQTGHGWQWVRNANAPVSPPATVSGRAIPFRARIPLAATVGHHPALQSVTTATTLCNEYETDPRRVPLSHRQETLVTGWAWLPASQLTGDTAWPQVAQLPETALSYPVPEPEGVTVDKAAHTMSNAHLSVVFEPDGTLAITDRQTGQRFEQLNRGMMLVDKGDSYNRCPVPSVPPEPWELANVKWIAQGPVCAEAELSLRFPTRPHPVDWVRCRVRLLASTRRVELDWQWTPPLPSRLIQTGFYQPELTTRLTVADVFGTIQRTHPLWADRFEGFPVTEASDEWLPNGGYHHGLVQSPSGGTVLTDGLPDYELVDGRWLYLTLHRGFGAISGGAMPSRGTPAGPPVETPQGHCIGRALQARYAWLPPGLDEPTLAAERAAFLRTEWLALDQKRPLTSNDRPGVVTADLPPLPHGVTVLALDWEQRKPADDIAYPIAGWVVRLHNSGSNPVVWAIDPGQFSAIERLNGLHDPMPWSLYGGLPTLDDQGLHLLPGGIVTVWL